MPGRCRLLLPETATVPEWLHARTRGIGGSEVAALLGVSPYATAFDVFRNKVDENGKPRFLAPYPKKGRKVRAELLTDNPVFEWGHRLEDAIAVKAADDLGLVGRSGGGLWQHLDHEIAIVTPDRVATARRSWEPVGLIECKTSTEPEAWENNDAPLHYKIQAQWQMGITGISPCYLSCLLLDYERTFHIRKIVFDDVWFAEMVEVAERFWEQHVLTGEPPMHDLTHPHTTDLLAELHPHVVRESVQLGDGAREWIEAYHQAKEVVKVAETRLDEIKNWLKVQLGDAGSGYIEDEKVVGFPEVTTRRIAVTKLRELFPEIAEQVTETTTHRRMTVKKLK